jgi:hypothetical protein
MSSELSDADAAARWGWDDANTTADAPSTPRLRAIPADEAMQEPVPEEIIEGVAWANCVTVLVAESSAGKTFVALDLAAAVSAGLNWHGRAVTQGAVVHIGYEGDAIGLRLRAMHEHRQARLEHVYRIRAADPLSPLVTREGEQRSPGERDLLAALQVLRAALSVDEQSLVLLIVDTVRASLQGSEDSSESVSAYLRVIRRLLESLPGTAALLVHHAGWQDGEQQKKRERGSSAFRGNVDATLYLEAGDYNHATQSAPLTLTTHKVRDGEKPAPLHMIRQRVIFPEVNAHGLPITSCVIDPDPRTESDFRAEADARVTAAHEIEDRRVLRLLSAHPDLTSQDAVRTLLGGRKETANATIVRLILAKWITKPTRGPYTLTLLGRQALVDT